MGKADSTFSIILVLLITVFSLPVCAQDTPPAADDWEIQFIPYFFMPSLDAEGTIGRLSGTIDLSFGDVLDYLDMAAMGRVEVWKGKWGLSFDGLYMNLGASGSFEGINGATQFDLDADVRLGMVDFAAAYRLYERRFGEDQKQRLAFEPYGGLRYCYLREKVDLNIDIPGIGPVGARRGGSEEWFEPFVGGRLLWDLNETVRFNLRGDAGGFGMNDASDLLWQVAFGIDYKLSPNMTLNAGYRIVDLDYSHGSGSETLGIDLRAKGPVLGLTITF